MQPSNQYDVVIVGAGPAGSHLGYLLACRSVKVLIIDKKELPRYKPCGGGLTRRAMQLLSFDLTPVIEDYARTAVVSIDNTPVYHQSFSEPIIGMVMRDRFDSLLLDRATRAGSHCMTGTRFMGVTPHADGLRIITSNDRFETKLVVGADGVNSAVARALRLRVKSRCFYAIEGEVYCRSARDLAAFKGTVHFDFGVIPQGYGWVFPKKDHLSIGVLTSGTGPKPLKKYFNNYLAKKNLATVSRVKLLRGHLIPWGLGRKSVFSNRHGLLVGDAAGFSDPITGEGIFHALQQGQMAAPVILNQLRHCGSGLAAYRRHMQRAYGREMFHGCGMSWFLYHCERLSHHILRHSGDLLAEQFLQIITGQATYPDLSSKLLRPLKMIQLLRGSNKTVSRR